MPWDFWQNNASYRVTAWYGFPNGVGLFLAPLVPLAIYLVIHSFEELKNIKNFKFQISNFKSSSNIQYSIFNISLLLISFSFLISVPFAILFAKSTGAIIGLAAGIGFLLLLNKKTRLITITVSIVSLVSLVSLPFDNSIKQELLFRDRSGQIRLAIWKETYHFLSDHPLAGAGLASYQTKIAPYHTTVNGEGIEIFHHPHNIFLTMWINLGLLGLISFVWILILIFNLQSLIFKKTHKLPTLNKYLIACIITILTTGLVDSPYIKNDLALLFWTIIALIMTSSNPNKVDKTG